MAIDTTTLITSRDVRRACRSGTFRGVTTGLAPEQVQANLIVVPQKYASDFRNLCRRNPVSCCLLGENVAPGDHRLAKRLASSGDSDVRRDCPGYNIYENGQLIAKDIPDIDTVWQDDSVAFLIGCSFTFEQALVAAGLPPRHQKLGRNVPMYKTTYPLLPSGVFSGNMVVSMRPYKLEDVDRVREITRPYIETHGEPVAWGEEGAKMLGIVDVTKPEFGDPPVIQEGEIPVYWGCGVTPQLVLMASKVDGICIGHAPGKMLCLDLAIQDTLAS